MPDNLIDNSVVERYAGLEGRDLIKSILRDYPGRTALVSSFGAESAELLHMVSEVDPNLPVIFLDTGKLFEETLDYRDKLIVELGLTDVRSVIPKLLIFSHRMARASCTRAMAMPAATSARPYRLKKHWRNLTW